MRSGNFARLSKHRWLTHSGRLAHKRDHPPGTDRVHIPGSSPLDELTVT